MHMHGPSLIRWGKPAPKREGQKVVCKYMLAGPAGVLFQNLALLCVRTVCFALVLVWHTQDGIGWLAAGV